jgi:hypothetical protein
MAAASRADLGKQRDQIPATPHSLLLAPDRQFTAPQVQPGVLLSTPIDMFIGFGPQIEPQAVVTPGRIDDPASQPSTFLPEF